MNSKIQLLEIKRYLMRGAPLLLLLTGSCNVVAATAQLIGEQAAQEIAIKQSGVNPAQTQINKMRTELNKDQTEYEVEFTANGVNYLYEIDAKDGNMVDYTKERVQNLDQQVGTAVEDIQNIKLD